MPRLVLATWLAVLVPFASACGAEPARDVLVFSVRKWSGEYETRDVPGGVQTTPATSSIHSIHADGTNLRRLVAIKGAVCASPAFGPEGKWLYFQSNATGQYHLYRCRPDGSGRQQLTSADKPGPPWTSVFGLQVTAQGNLLCTVSDGKSGRVAVLAADGSKLQIVAPHLGYLYMSAISPRGDVVVCSGPASGYRLWAFQLPAAFQTGNERPRGPAVNLAADHPHSYAPQFTPDGQTIVYLRRDGDIYRVAADGTGRKRLTRGNRYVEFRLGPKDRHGSTDGPHLSPDGKRIAYVSRIGGTPNVWTANIDGSAPRQLTFRKSPCGRVRWSPDGKRIAFVSFVGKWPQLFVAGADGGKPRQLTRLEGAVDSINWMPRQQPKKLRNRS